jgi:predicted RNA-binding Zn ribbon-like protein
MPDHPSDAAPERLLPGAPEGLCLAFANTRFWRGSPAPTETLHGPADLIHWCATNGMAEPGTVAAVAARWEAAPAEAAAAFATGLQWREAIYRALAAEAAGTALAAEDVEALDKAIGAAPPRRHLRRDSAESWRWVLPPAAPGLAALLTPVLWSAGDLLAGGRLDRVRRCANDRCLWLFLDDSKSGTRRWCSMASCGNRAKAHRHYARRRDPPPG